MTTLRWTTRADQPGLFERERRVVGRGEFRGLTFHEVESRTILNRIPRGPLPFEWTINAYRGCSHACVYCFARATHDYLGLGIGEDFDTQIVVKANAVELVRYETAPGRWDGSPIAMGTNTDPYQRAEGKYKLTRGILQVLVERANPFSVLTKSPLLLRDLDVLVEGSRRAEVSVALSIGTLDEAVWKATEPGTPHPRQRLAAVSKLSAAGLSVSVLVAPILPGISEDRVDEVVRACLDAGAEQATPIRLHLRAGVKEHYMEWLGRTRPELVGLYDELYRTGAYLPRASRRAARPVRSSPQLSMEL